MAFTDRQKRILETAIQHEGRFLLQHSFGRHDPPSERDLDYDACDALVFSGWARRLPWSIHEGGPGPGIELTRHPEEVRDALAG